MSAASLAGLLFSFGAILVAVGFAAHVGHAVLLANGRRSLVALSRTIPVYAGVATGSFVAARQAAAASLPVAVAASPLSGVAGWLTVTGWAALGGSLLLRGLIVGRGPWGNLYEFSLAFAFSIIGG